MVSLSLSKALLALPLFLAGIAAACEPFSNIQQEYSWGFFGIGGQPEIRWDYGVQLFTAEHCSAAPAFYKRDMVPNKVSWLDEVYCNQIQTNGPVESLVAYGKQNSDHDYYCTVVFFTDPHCTDQWDNTYHTNDRLADNWAQVNEWLIRENVDGAVKSWQVQCMDLDSTITSFDPFT